MIQFFKALWDNVTDMQWWASELPGFLIFTILVGVCVWFLNKWREKLYRKEFENWHLIILWNGTETKQELFWEEVERFEKSDFERWKLIKSVVSGMGTANLTTVHKAQQEGWVSIKKEIKEIKVDLDKACKVGHVEPKVKPNDKKQASHISQ